MKKHITKYSLLLLINSFQLYSTVYNNKKSDSKFYTEGALKNRYNQTSQLNAKDRLKVEKGIANKIEKSRMQRDALKKIYDIKHAEALGKYYTNGLNPLNKKSIDIVSLKNINDVNVFLESFRSSPTKKAKILAYMLQNSDNKELQDEGFNLQWLEFHLSLAKIDTKAGKTPEDYYKANVLNYVYKLNILDNHPLIKNMFDEHPILQELYQDALKIKYMIKSVKNDQDVLNLLNDKKIRNLKENWQLHFIFDTLSEHSNNQNTISPLLKEEIKLIMDLLFYADLKLFKEDNEKKAKELPNLKILGNENIIQNVIDLVQKVN